MSQNNSKKKKNGVSPLPKPEPTMILVETPYAPVNDFPQLLNTPPVEKPKTQQQGGGRQRPCLLSQR